MRALSLLEPWATLVALGIKRVETRGRPVGLRVGEEFAVHASRGAVDESLYRDVVRAAGRESIQAAPGFIVALATIKAIEPSDGFIPSGWMDGATPEERTRAYALGDFAKGRMLYLLSDIYKLGCPIAARGMQGPWTVDPSVAERLVGAHRTKV